MPILLGCNPDPAKHLVNDSHFDEVRAGFKKRCGIVKSENTDLCQYAVVGTQKGQSCVGWSFAQNASILDRKLGNNITYSSLATYFLAKVHEYYMDVGVFPPIDYQHRDCGTYLRAAAIACEKLGLVEEGPLDQGKWALEESLILRAPSMQCLNNAIKSRGTKYYRISGSLEDRIADMKYCISAGYPVCISIDVDEDIVNWTGTSAISTPTGAILGGHALCAISYRSDDSFCVVSSWGDSWGDNGFTWINPIAINNDIWSFADANL